ncbi:MAG: cadherin-like domain-containing protein, partial [Candidatus Bipolaricaulota bacterium]|nr:cadherin-like domain-containing protein [Candidatus Bipolaricaulota bacterium]MDW8152603.1 cadherin-like domain-containing protein [Candidatus Bipolaricaulota bacterium]
NDSYTTYKNTPLNVGAPGVLANDSDPDGDALTAHLVSGPAQGSVMLNSNGSFTYTPPANWTGTTTFTYRAKDTSNAYSNTATVTITVKEPVAAADDHYEVRAGSTLVVEAPGVLANDRDPTGGTLTAHWVPGSGPHYGTLDYFSPTGAFRYRPNADFAGSDSFRYVARN